MKKIILVVFATLYSTFFLAQQTKPKLIVGIIVDQMRDEYIDRFYSDFGNEGFKRLINEGFRMKNLHFNYMPTYTAPGHASVYTGTTPRYHGIVSNDWFHRQTHQDIYCTYDDDFTILGPGKEKDGKMSPNRLKTTTITDELRLSTNLKGKVIGMSIKDRGAILPAGHLANWAFWMNSDGNFISSTYYGSELPSWVTEFNNAKHYETYLKKGWKLLKPASDYNESLPDKNPYEGKLNWSLEPVFPYDLYTEYQKKGAGIIKVTPWGNSILADLAMKAVEKESLGKDNITDFLAVSFSSPDYIGHVVGPRSMELQDMYLRLDLTIAEMLKFLDKNVGKGNYMVFLTADHACGENPNFLHDNKMEVKNLDYKELKKDFEKVSTELYNVNLIRNYDNQNIHFDIAKIDSIGLNREMVFRKFQEKLELIPYVKRAYTEEELMDCSPDFLHKSIANGFDIKQSGQIVLLFEPAYMEYGYTGTSHGTPYGYDTHVPGLFYGWNIPKGVSYEKHFITEIAPTISQLLHFTLPSGSENIVIKELLKK
ncbi:MAG: alkaline phosphatase PafA [Deltaproteobacteria bacterium]